MDKQREIKFRLRIDNKVVGYEKWYRSKKQTKDDKTGAKAQWLYSKDDKYWNPKYIEHDEKDQYTGLKDKNGKEIYGGDILRLVDDNGKTFDSTVRWINWDSSFRLVELKNWDKDIGTDLLIEPVGQHLAIQKVIGNIYENPEKENNKTKINDDIYGGSSYPLQRVK